MEQAFYRDRLASHGLTFLVPDRQDRAAVHAIIYDELGQGIVLDASRDRYREAIARLTAAGAQTRLELAAARTRRRLHTSQREERAAALTRIRAASGDDVADLLGRAVLGVKGGGPLG